MQFTARAGRSSTRSRARRPSEAALCNLRGGRHGRHAGLQPALRDRPRQRDPVLPVDRLRQYPDGIERHRTAPRSPTSATSARRRTSRSCSRPARCRWSLRPARAARTSRPRSARTRCSEAKKRAAIGLLLVALFLLARLPLPRRRRGDRPGHLRGLPLRGDPPLQRHADPAGLRRHDPHDRRRGRREHRHLRTDQGRGARREIRPRGDRGRLLEGLPHDRRRERRHGDHRARAVRGGDRGREGLRADAPARHRHLADHGGRRDAGDARPAGGLPLVRQPATSWARAASRARRGSRSTSSAPVLWFAISAAWSSIALASLGVKGLNLGIDFKGGTQVVFTTPQPTAIADVRARRRRSGRSDAVIQGNGQASAASTRSSRSGPRRSTPAEQSQLSPRPAARRSARRTSSGIQTVSASFGRQIAEARDLGDLRLAAADRRSTSRCASTGSSPCRRSWPCSTTS